MASLWSLKRSDLLAGILAVALGAASGTIIVINGGPESHDTLICDHADHEAPSGEQIDCIDSDYDPLTPLEPGDFPDIDSNFDINDYITGGGRVVPSSAGDPSGNWRGTCEFSHFAWDDPIVNPGVEGAAHLHLFFGNTLTNADSTWNSLRTTGDGTCSGGPINRTGYWAPALYKDSTTVIVPDDIILYYKDGGHAQTALPVTHIPNGLRMIAGYTPATPSVIGGSLAEGSAHFEWRCYPLAGGEYKTETIDGVNCDNTGDLIEIFQEFPQCWDGENLDSEDHRSHMAYIEYVEGDPVCPSSHPVEFSGIAVGLLYSVVDGEDPDTWYLSSDSMYGKTNGGSFHTDWFGAWDKNIIDQIVDVCINGTPPYPAGLDCQTGEIGDTTSLDIPPNYTGDRLVTPPADPTP